MEHIQQVQSAQSVLRFIHLIELLKNIPRRGWVLKGVRSPESVSDHMYRMSLMAWMVPGIDEQTRTRAIKMALAHDMGEAIIGDITPHDGVSKEEKFLRERLAVKYLSCLAKQVNSTFADEIEELWLEFETGTSKAAQLVRGIDTLECLDQAVIYEERSGLANNLEEFMNLRSEIEAPELASWTACIMQEREAVWSMGAADIVVLFIIGGPGVGKGTQSSRIGQDFGFCHLSVGDLLRREATSPTSVFADFIDDSIRNSVIIPPDLSMQLLKKEMAELKAKGHRLFAIDGFPRSLDQANAFNEKIHRQHATILLEGSEDTLLQHLKERSGSSGRIDNNAESIRKRLQTFTRDNAEIEEYLRRTGPFWKINANGSVDEVYESVKEVLEEILQNNNNNSSSSSSKKPLLESQDIE